VFILSLYLIDLKIEYIKIDNFYSDPLPDMRPDLEASGYSAFACNSRMALRIMGCHELSAFSSSELEFAMLME
jgi:hypothetical protein